MKSLLCTLTFGLLFCAWVALAADTPGSPVHLTLEQCIETALHVSTTFLKTRNDAEAAGAQLLQGYAQFLPTVDTSLSYGYNSGTQITAISGFGSYYSRNRSGNFVITSTLNLFNGLSDYAALKSALSRKSAADLTLGFARQQIALDITQTFLQVVLDEQLITIAVHNLEASDARLKLLRGQYLVGQTSPADLQRQQAQRAADDQAVTNTQIRRHDDLLLLIRKIRMDPTFDYKIETPILTVAPGGLYSRDEGELVRLALNQRKDLQSSESLLTASEWDITTTRAPYYPRLDLNFTRFGAGYYFWNAEYGGHPSTPPAQSDLIPQIGNQVNYALTLTLSWNIFNRLITKTAVTRARLVSDNARIDSEDARIRAVADVRQAKGDFAAASRQVQSTRVGVAAAQEAYNTIEGRYLVGASSFIDVLAAQSTLVTAQASEAQAVINLKYEEKLLEFATGSL